MADRYSCRRERKTSLFHTHYNSHSSSSNPSFSSMLLDAIYRSIDKAEEEMNVYRKMAEDANVRAALIKSDDEMANNYQRACMIEKWMENKVSEKIADRRKSAMDELYVKKPRKDRQISSSSSSDSSCRGSSGGGFFSSSEGESFPSERRKPVQIRGWKKFSEKCYMSSFSSQLVHQSVRSTRKKCDDSNFSNKFVCQSINPSSKNTLVSNFSNQCIRQSNGPVLSKTYNIFEFSSRSQQSTSSRTKNVKVSDLSSQFVHQFTSLLSKNCFDSSFSKRFNNQTIGQLSSLVNNISATIHLKIQREFSAPSNRESSKYNSRDIHNNRYETRCYKSHPGKQGLGDQSKQKSRALKIHGNLKKVKKPISPGGKLSAFLNSLFTSGNLKRPKLRSSDDSPTTNPSTCSSSSTFTVSCLTKTSWSWRKFSDRPKGSVKFSPVSVIVDDDSHELLHHEKNNTNIIKTTINEELMNFQKENDDLRKTHVEFDHQDYDEEDDTEFDAVSGASSDLFELDNILGIGMDDGRYRKELPVYETTCS